MSDRVSELRPLFKRAVAAGLAPGIVAQWGKAGETPLGECTGFSTLRPEASPVSGTTWFDLASLSKPLVTTTLTLLAFRTSVLGPATVVGEVLDELRDTAVGEIPIRLLLTHTSGLPAWLPLYSLAEGKPQNLVQRLAEIDLEAAPGSRVIYSCVGFVILGLMLTRISDTGLDRLFRREVLDVLGLSQRLGFCPDPKIHRLAGGALRPVAEESMVRGLGFDPRWIPPMKTGLPDDGNARFLDGVAGNAGLFGTVEGVAALAAEYLPGGGRLLTSEEATTSTTRYTGGLGEDRAFGWQVASTDGCSAGPGLSPESFGHTGFTGVSVWADPSSRGVFVLLTNRNHPGQREINLHPLRRRFHVLAAKTLTG